MFRRRHSRDGRAPHVEYDFSSGAAIHIAASTAPQPLRIERIQVSHVSQSAAGLVLRGTVTAASDDFVKLCTRRRECHVSFFEPASEFFSRLPGSVVFIEPKRMQDGLQLNLAIRLPQSDPGVTAWWEQFKRSRGAARQAVRL